MSTDISVADGSNPPATPVSRELPAPNGNGTPAAPSAPGTWTPADSARVYGIDHWGQGYFSVTPDGTVAVHPTAEKLRSIDLKKLVDELRERDIQPPLL